ncbi:aquaporin [Salaquimonas pukyongi]|uniref:aquaporin n=1 Tax=Salaquimonas pukyongi TaxID=2712698 RepID=UPI00096BCD7F|nr:MIP/aquaporin family protein [Salaquimonas pukyongi]
MAEADGKQLVSEFLGTALLLATVVGSGIMAENLAGGNIAIALLANTIATGAILYVLITMFGPVSGAHFNPAVTFAFWLRREIAPAPAGLYVVVQILGGIAGVLLANAMFDLAVFQISEKLRSSPGQWLSEAVAAFGLVLAIFMTLRARPELVAPVVGLYITAAYWFTASTSFANPAVTIARQFSNTFAGIAPSSVAIFIAAQIAGAAIAFWLDRYLAAPGKSA